MELIGRSVEIINKKRKNLIIHTNENEINSIENKLNKYKIPFEFMIKNNTSEIHNNLIIQFGLPPFNSTRKINYRFLIDLKFEEKVKKILDLEQVQKSSYYYKLSSFQKKKYFFEYQKNPKFPIYIVSFNRFDFCYYTVSNLEKMKVKYWLCIQKSQEKNYKKLLNNNNYSYCLGLVLSENTTQGGYKQRNKCMEHARQNKFKKCWILDDNIQGWSLQNQGEHLINNGFCFSFIENWIENIKEPIGIFSHSYSFDIRQNQLTKPYYVNSKNYSSLLLDLDLLKTNNIKWRLKYNEDVDLTLQCLYKKIYTLSSNFLTCNKMPTLSCKGGNTTSIYEQGKKFDEKFDTLYNKWKNTKFKDSIKKIIKHEDGRTHHLVNYSNIEKIQNLNDFITPKKKFKKEKSLKDFDIKIC
tara:strand:+ start:10037 stop:11269 length:1233 start_codon:yes stop_codon:yes gene_type:complete